MLRAWHTFGTYWENICKKLGRVPKTICIALLREINTKSPLDEELGEDLGRDQPENQFTVDTQNTITCDTSAKFHTLQGRRWVSVNRNGAFSRVQHSTGSIRPYYRTDNNGWNHNNTKRHVFPARRQKLHYRKKRRVRERKINAHCCDY